MSSSQEKSSTGVVSMIYKSRTTLLELLREQRYDVGDYENFGVNEIHAMYTNKDAPKQLDMVCSSNKGSTKQKKVYVICIYLLSTLSLKHNITCVYTVQRL